MERRTLGAFIDKTTVRTPIEFFRLAWAKFVTGPTFLQPKRVGNWEPLKKVEEAALFDVLKTDFIVSNGRRVLGMVSSPAFLEHRYYSITLLLSLAQRDLQMADEAYEWLRDHFPVTIVYMGTPSAEMFRNHREFHQMLNSGLVEISLEKGLSKYQHLLDRFDRIA